MAENLRKLRIPINLSGIEPSNFRLVAQYLIQLRHITNCISMGGDIISVCCYILIIISVHNLGYLVHQRLLVSDPSVAFYVSYVFLHSQFQNYFLFSTYSSFIAVFYFPIVASPICCYMLLLIR